MNRVIDHGVWIESDAPLADTPQWSTPLRLVKAVAEGEAANLGSISPLLAGNLETICDIYAAWIDGHKVPLNFEISSNIANAASGVSLFFSGGVDSSYSLIKHQEEIDNLILVHGFDVPVVDTEAFALAETRVRETARLFDKRLIVVRTNLREEQPHIREGWGMYHGAALATVALALAPSHGKVYIASSTSYPFLHPWGSHPLLDPLWSTEAVKIVHDGGETRMNKLRVVIQYPEVLSRLRVCWENPRSYNCGLCGTCIKTMLGLRALGIEHCAAFPDTLTPERVRQQAILPRSIDVWQEMLCPGLPPALYVATQSVIHNCKVGLPPPSGKWKRGARRWLYAVRNAWKALISPITES